MIELTASLFNLQMLAAPEVMGETGAEVAVSGQFARLLAANLDQSADPGAAVPPPVQMVPPRPPAANGIAAGKAGGKMLPVMAVPAGLEPALPGEACCEGPETLDAAKPVEAHSEESPASPAMPIPSEPAAAAAAFYPPVLPGQTAAAAPISVARDTRSQSSTPAAARQAPHAAAIAPVRSDLPALPGPKSASVAARRIQPALPETPETALAPQSQVAVRRPITSPSLPLPLAAGPAPTASPQVTELAPVQVQPPLQVQAIALTIPAAVAPFAPFALHPRTIAIQPAALTSQPLPPAQAESPVELPALAPIAVPAAVPAPDARIARSGVEAAPAPLQESVQPPLPTEALPQPADSRIAAPLVPQHSAETASTPPSVAQPQRPDAPRDFSALIDRLVEAREAARTTLAPQAVQAAVAHADFGKVELRFEQNAGQLSVSLASADPDFARAVQAAAPAAQQQDLPRDTGPQPQRHDTGERPSAGSNFAQSQQQPHSQRTASAEPRSPERHEPQPRSDARGPRRNGIFA